MFTRNHHKAAFPAVRFAPHVSFSILFALLSLLTTLSVAQAADVTWVGSANGQWHIDANWSGGAVPQPADNITISGNVAVTVSDARMLTGVFTLEDNALLRLEGESTSFAANGSTSISNGRVSVTEGAQATFPTVVEYVWSRCEDGFIFSVDGTDSVLTLENLESIHIEASDCENLIANILVVNNGVLDLSGLVSATAVDMQQVTFGIVTGGTVLTPNAERFDGAFLNLGADIAMDFPLLTSLTGCQVTVPTTGRWTLPMLTTLTNTFLTLGNDSFLSVPNLERMEANDASATFSALETGAISAPKLTSVRNVVFVASLGAVVNLPSVRTYVWDLCEGAPLFATSGTDTTLNFAGLESIAIQNSGCTGLAYSATAISGSKVDLSGLRTLTIPTGNFFNFFASNTGTEIDVSSLSNFNATIVTFFETDGGRIIRGSGTGGEGEGEGEGEGPTPSACPAPSKTGSVRSAALFGDLFLLAAVVGGLASLGSRRRQS